jgi:hypothetical protein
MRRDLLAAARTRPVELPEEDVVKPMRRLFAERIEEKQDMLRRFHGGSAPTHIPLAEPDDGVDLPSVVEDLSTIHTAADVHDPSAPRARARRFVAPVLAVVALAGAGAFALSQRADGPLATSPQAPTAAASETVAAPSTAPSPAPAAEIELRIETTPPGASVLVGDQERGTTPIVPRCRRANRG